MIFSDVLLRLKELISGDKSNIETISQNKEDKILNEVTAVADPEYKDRSVLVGVIRNPRQLDILIREKFYHIPLSQVNECQFPVKYVSIYQSKRLFGKNAGIRYYGKVESCTTLKRNKIREIPRMSQEKYLYFKIKNWQRLEKNIEAKEMEVTAFSTTPYMLKNCKDSAELQLRSREEHLLYIKLTKTVKMLVRDRIPDGEDIVYKDYTVKLKDGMLYLYFADVLEYVIGYDIFLDNPTNVIRDIFDYYPEL